MILALLGGHEIFGLLIQAVCNRCHTLPPIGGDMPGMRCLFIALTISPKCRQRFGGTLGQILCHGSKVLCHLAVLTMLLFGLSSLPSTALGKRILKSSNIKAPLLIAYPLLFRQLLEVLSHLGKGCHCLRKLLGRLLRCCATHQCIVDLCQFIAELIQGC